MKCFTIVIAGALCVTGFAQPAMEASPVSEVTAGPTLPDSMNTAPAPERPDKTPLTLSTQLEGVDSLKVAPGEIITSYEGGTRRINVEQTVFRREPPVIYDEQGQRDPFRALIADEKKEGPVETDLCRVDGAVLTGVVWSGGEYLALVKEKEGRNFFLREGDSVYQGLILSVTQSQAVFEITNFGTTERIVLKVQG